MSAPGRNGYEGFFSGLSLALWREAIAPEQTAAEVAFLEEVFGAEAGPLQLLDAPSGNGRHARLMTDVLLENVLSQPRFTWGSTDLSRPGDTRRKYIDALHAADGQNYQPLTAFVRT